MQHTVSTKTLVKASISAVVVAAIALVTFILPAEYNIDPTGIGNKLGLTELAQAVEMETLETHIMNKLGYPDPYQNDVHVLR